MHQPHDRHHHPVKEYGSVSASFFYRRKWIQYVMKESRKDGYQIFALYNMLSLPNESKEEACQVAENSECPRSISLHIVCRKPSYLWLGLRNEAWQSQHRFMCNNNNLNIAYNWCYLWHVCKMTTFSPWGKTSVRACSSCSKNTSSCIVHNSVPLRR